MRQRTARLRTITLVASGACLFVTLGMLTSNGESGVTQIAAYVVSGVDFLGGGVMHDKGSIQGINTAATLVVLRRCRHALRQRPFRPGDRGHGHRVRHQYSAARSEPHDQRAARVERARQKALTVCLKLRDALRLGFQRLQRLQSLCGKLSPLRARKRRALHDANAVVRERIVHDQIAGSEPWHRSQ